MLKSLIAGLLALLAIFGVHTAAPATSSPLLHASTPHSSAPFDAERYFTASPTSGTDPLTVTVHFEQDLGNVIDFGDAAAYPANVPGSDCSDAVCSISHTYDTTGSYEIKLYKLGNPCNTAVCFEGSTPVESSNITVTGFSDKNASATFDQNEVTFTALPSGIDHATFSGTASGTSQLDIFIVPSSYAGSPDFNQLRELPPGYGAASKTVPVEKGHWSAGFSGSLAGTYKVYIFDFAQCIPNLSSCDTAFLLSSGVVAFRTKAADF